MSAALIAFLPILLKNAPGWIQSINDLFKGKPKSGTDKAATLLEWVRALATKFIAAQIPLPGGAVLKEQPSDAELMTALETIFQDMKAKGEVDGPVPPPPNDPTLLTTTNSFYILKGSVTAIKL